jgi:hypothetical protein
MVVSTLFDGFGSETPLGLRIQSFSWWQQRWGSFWLSSKFIAALPFCPACDDFVAIDALSVKPLQETNYPPAAKNAVLELDATFMSFPCAIWTEPCWAFPYRRPSGAAL